MGENASSASSSEMVAGPLWAPGMEDLARFRALTRNHAMTIHSEIRGASMEPTMPNGARLRIHSGAQESWHLGQVIAFLAGSRLAAHRIVHEGRSAAAQQFVLTHGDHNWLCDPPVNRSMIVG